MRTASEAKIRALAFRPVSKGYEQLKLAIEESILKGRLNLYSSHRNKDDTLIYDYEWEELESLGYKLSQMGNYLNISWS